MKYTRLVTKTNVRRSFRIVCALREGYSSEAKIHEPDEAISIIHRWMKKRAEANQPYLTGSCTQETVVYTWKGANNNDDAPEPAIVYQGDVSIIYNHETSDEEVREMLDELAACLGMALLQTRVYISYKGETWILQAEGQFSPREKEVLYE